MKFYCCQCHRLTKHIYRQTGVRARDRRLQVKCSTEWAIRIAFIFSHLLWTRVNLVHTSPLRNSKVYKVPEFPCISDMLYYRPQDCHGVPCWAPMSQVEKNVTRPGLESGTHRLQGECSTEWAIRTVCIFSHQLWTRVNPFHQYMSPGLLVIPSLVDAN